MFNMARLTNTSIRFLHHNNATSVLASLKRKYSPVSQANCNRHEERRLSVVIRQVTFVFFHLLYYPLVALALPSICSSDPGSRSGPPSHLPTTQ